MTNIIDTYIFDLDDTIIDNSIYAKMYNEVLNQLMKSLKLSEIELQEKITKLKEISGKERVDTYELCKKLSATELYYKILEKYIKHTYTMKTKSIPVIFRKIKSQDRKIGVVSNAQERTIKMFLKHFHLFEHVTFIASGDKESVVFWVTLEKRFNLEKEKTLVIDDSEEILKVAEHVGYKTLNVDNIENIDEFNKF